MKNIDIRDYAKEKQVHLWEISEYLGFAHETAFSRVLRHELEEEKKAELKKIIDQMANDRRWFNEARKDFYKYGGKGAENGRSSDSIIVTK